MNARQVKKAAMREAGESGEGGHAKSPPSAIPAVPAWPEEEALAEAFCALHSADEVRAFLRDLCTPTEISALSERWHVARLLDAGELSYRDIHDRTGVSTTTVSRVARFLFNEPYRGYRLVLERLKEGSRGQKPS